MPAELEPIVPPAVGGTVVPSAADAASDATERVGRGWTVRFGVAWLGFWMANLVPIQLLLPDQLARIDPAAKVRDFAVINGVSGAIALLALPICGALSDRSRSRFGRRRAWIAGGTVLFAAGLVLTGLQTHWGSLALAWSFSMLGLSAATAGLTAVVVDRVPGRQRGMISSAVYAPQALGVVLGIAVVAALGLTSLEGYVVIAAALLVLTVPFVRHYVEVPPAPGEVLRLRQVVGSLRIDVRAHPDFAWAFGGRLLVNLGNSLGTCYLLYFLTDALRVADPDGTLLALTVVYLVAALVTTYVAGVLSDRSGRRRIFVAVAGVLQALAGFLLAAFPGPGVAFVAAAMLGGGFGAYMSVDQALITQVLPDARSRAKDLGVMNIGTIVPPAVAPLLAGLLIDGAGHGYPALFATVGCTALLGAISTYKVRTVR
ncbi:Major Facilitator Superfamily protein [Jatrophihabitans endophyticus]|uniref:Major Facilitator Superfamily protein n=1 Tax=Jatrophihabitans endophyticus TaxID=1206085 RepID=A0A1M5QTY6_9ACTN|nr:MFS transporter [Jatrophihabitans endophyticus]SHH17594.1 Major Facilitator Superfamily protein [Jatrophihabitans endophyticus]